MNRDLLEMLPAIIADVEATERNGTDAVWRLESPMGVVRTDPDVEEELEYYLRSLEQKLLLHLEALGLVQSRATLECRWAEFERRGLREVKFAPGPGVAYSEALSYLGVFVQSLRCYGPTRDVAEKSFDELVLKLRKTAVLMERRNVIAGREKDVQDVMDDYLDFLYGTDYCRQFNLPGVVKNFKPDAGVRSLETAIEFKFADSKAALASALGGLFEDASGYKGNSDWTRFISVVYMTGAFGTEEEFKAAFDRADLIDWTPILVTGRSAPTRQKAGKRGGVSKPGSSQVPAT